MIPFYKIRLTWNTCHQVAWFPFCHHIHSYVSWKYFRKCIYLGAVIKILFSEVVFSRRDIQIYYMQYYFKSNYITKDIYPPKKSETTWIYVYLHLWKFSVQTATVLFASLLYLVWQQQTPINKHRNGSKKQSRVHHVKHRPWCMACSISIGGLKSFQVGITV